MFVLKLIVFIVALILISPYILYVISLIMVHRRGGNVGETIRRNMQNAGENVEDSYGYENKRTDFYDELKKEEEWEEEWRKCKDPYRDDPRVQRALEENPNLSSVEQYAIHWSSKSKYD